MSGNVQHREKPIPANDTKDPSSKFRDDISASLVANLVNRTYEVLHGPSRGAEDNECTIEQSGNLVKYMGNVHRHNALYGPPESSPGYTVENVITPKVSPDLPSRGKDEASPPTYPPESSGGCTVKDMVHPIVSTDLPSKGKDEASRGAKTKSKKEPKTKSAPTQKATHTQHRKKPHWRIIRRTHSPSRSLW
jgi:hypothetical protein